MRLSDKADNTQPLITWIRSLSDIDRAAAAGFQMLILDLCDLAMSACQGPAPATWTLADVPEIAAQCHAHWPHITLALHTDFPIHPAQKPLVERLIQALKTPHLSTLFVADLGLAAHIRVRLPDCRLIYSPVSGNHSIASQTALCTLFDGQVLSAEMPEAQIRKSLAEVQTDFYILALGRVTVHQSYRHYLNSGRQVTLAPTDPGEAARSLGVLPPQWHLTDTPFGTLIQTAQRLDLRTVCPALLPLGLKGMLMDFRDRETGHGYTPVEEAATHLAMWQGNSTDQAVRTVFRHTDDQYDLVGRVLDVIRGTCMVVEIRSPVTLTDSLCLCTPEGRQVAMTGYWMQNVGGVTIFRAETDQIVRFRFYKGAIPGSVISRNRSHI